MTSFAIDFMKAGDLAFLCTSAWEGGFSVGFAAGIAAVVAVALLARVFLGVRK